LYGQHHNEVPLPGSGNGAEPVPGGAEAVTGVLEHGNREWIVRAVRVEHVDAPSNPYLSFAT
jgi:hypothetical protein